MKFYIIKVRKCSLPIVKHREGGLWLEILILLMLLGINTNVDNKHSRISNMIVSI